MRLPRRPAAAHRLRPGRVVALRGIIIQSDGRSTVGRLVIRPLAALDRFLAGVVPSLTRPPLAMHAGLRVVLEDGREVVAEQLLGGWYMDLISGLSWTPLEQFRARDRGGWDVTVPATAFRGVDERAEAAAVAELNRIEGHPFVGVDCTAFVERAFEGRRLFADSPLLSLFGIPARVGDPALPLLRGDVRLDERAERLLHADAVRRLPDATAHPRSPNVRLWAGRMVVAAIVGALLGFLNARH
jgi:hypothetical protein